MNYLTTFNMDDINIHLHNRENYIIGENLIGKTHVLSRMFQQYKENNYNFALYFSFSYILHLKNFTITDKVKRISTLFPSFKFNEFEFITIYSKRVSFDAIPLSLNNIISLVYSIDINFRGKPGVVFIDNYADSLSPTYQYKLMAFLRAEFPLIQFIVATNNLNVIQGASFSSNVYSLYRDEGDLFAYLLKDLSEFTLNKLATAGIYDLETCALKKFTKNSAMSSDDYPYSLIHKRVSERIKFLPPLDDKIIDFIDIELKKI